MSNTTMLTIAEASRQLQAGTLTSVQLVEQVIANTAAKDDNAALLQMADGT